MTQISHRTIETNGIEMHLAEGGTGPLVVLCHGFPEILVFLAVQIDGSEHAWFEDSGAPCTLLAFVDDATSRLMQLRFVTSEFGV